MRLYVLTLCLLLLSACGQKGPLYLPDQNSGEDVPAIQDETSEEAEARQSANRKK